MKFKQLLAAALLFCTAGAWAQTDVTSTYITNADFSQGTALTSTYLYGYAKDGTPYGFQDVDGWTSVVTARNDGYGFAGGTFAYGSTTHLKGNDKGAPSADPDGNAGQCLGFFAVWGAGGYYYQDVTFAAGKYTLTFPIYNQSGTQANTTYTGFFPTSGTNRTVAINTTVGSWVNQTVTFTLATETAGQIRIGYQSTGSGSGANPMLFFDGVKIEFTAQVVKTVLENAIAAANTANASLKSSDLSTAITNAQTVYSNDDATQDEVNAAAATLNTAVELAMSAAGDATFLISNPGFESCTVSTDNAAAGGSAAPRAIDGDWTQVSSAAWSSSAVVEYGGAGQVNGASAPATDNLANGGYTLGVSVGWGGVVTYKTAGINFPAGVYTFKVNAYNNLSGVTQFKSLFGFVPTEGTATLSTKTSFAYATWETDQVTVTLNEATEGYIQVGGQAISGGSGSNAKVFFDNITIGYKSFLAGAKAAYDEAVADAEAAKTECANVTGDELTALNAELEKAEPTTVEGYNAAAEAINTATATLTAAKASYDAFVAAKTADTPELAYAAADKKTALTEAKAATANTATEAATATAAITTALRAYYESHAMAEGVEGAVDQTSLVAAANADTNTGWTNGIGTNQGQGYTDAAGTVAAKYLDGGWAQSTGVNIDMTRTVEIPAGKYLLTATARGAEALDTYTLSIGGQTVNLPKNGSNGGVFGNGWDDVSVEFVTDGTAQTLEVVAKSEAAQQWISINRFRLVRLELYTQMADADDYAALNAAIAAAEAKTLGFDKGEYAPYNNVEALKAIATAKAIDQNAENAKDDVTALTETLTNGWTANDGDVDAIFDGTLANAPIQATSENVVLPGWVTESGNTRQTFSGAGEGGKACLADAEDQVGLFVHPGTYNYGETTGYTMPLKAGVIYQAEAKYCAWTDGQNNNFTLTILKDNATIKTKSFGKVEAGADTEHALNAVKLYFEVEEDGNYVLSVIADGNTFVTDFHLKKAAAEGLTINESADYTPAETYANVTLKRTIKAGTWNTFVVPFDLSNEELKAAFGADVAVAEFSENSDDANAVEVAFNTMETPAITANKPVLLKGNAGSSFTFNGKLIKVGDAKVAGKNVDFVGTYDATTTVKAGDYFISADKLYKSIGATTVKGTRAYIDAKNAPAGVKLFIGGIETAISEINGTAVENGAIYNLAGQRVNKAQKGVFIVNGKKVIVK